MRNTNIFDLIHKVVLVILLMGTPAFGVAGGRESYI